MKWLVLHTKPRQELKIAQRINELGVKAYCPSYKELKQYSDRKKKVEMPLLPSYVLVYVSEKDRPIVFNISGVLRYVFWLGKPAEVRTEEVESLKENMRGVYNKVSISSLKKGDNHTISSGPLKGFKGKILKIFKNKLKLELPSLGILVSMHIAEA